MQTKGLTGISGVVGDSNQNTLHEGGGYTRVFFQKVIFSISGKLKKSQEEKNWQEMMHYPFQPSLKQQNH